MAVLQAAGEFVRNRSQGDREPWLSPRQRQDGLSMIVKGLSIITSNPLG
jgi:hypothetical protein